MLKERCTNLPQFSRQEVKFVPYWKDFTGLFLLCEISHIARTEKEFDRFFEGCEGVEFHPYLKVKGFHPDLSRYVGKEIISQYDSSYWEDSEIVAALIAAADEMAALIKGAMEKKEAWKKSKLKEEREEANWADVSPMASALARRQREENYALESPKYSIWGWKD